MITSWKHKGLKKFYETGSKAGIQPSHEFRIKMILQLLNAAIRPNDMGLPGMNLHQLKGNQSDVYSVRVSGNWRITFKFEGENAVLVDYVDYH